MPRRSASLVLAIAFASFPLRAEVPPLLGYQGRLLRADGTAATGTAGVTFLVFAAENGGNPLWQESQTLGLSDGFYSTYLGLVAPTPDSLFDGGERWLEVRIGSETLSPRQRIGSVAFARTAQSVVGRADLLSLAVGGQTVIGADGRLSGPARYAAGPGLAVNDLSQTVSLQSCPSGQVLVSDGSSWSCADAKQGTVTAVGAAAPLGVSGDPATPVISMTRAASNASGYLSSVDWVSFNTKYGALTQCSGDLAGPLSAPTVTRLQSRPVVDRGPATGQVLKWSGTAWEPAGDADSGGTVRDVTAVAPLSIWNGTSTPQISIVQAGAGADGYLTSSDWARFEAKYGALTQCGGDLDGTLASPVVAKIQGVRVDTTIPTSAQVLRFDGSRWAPASLGISDVGGLSSGYLDLTGDQTIAGAKIFSVAPSFGTPLAVASGGLGTSTAAANALFAGPAGGAADVPGFRSLVSADIPLLDTASIPGLDASKITGGTLGVSNGGTGTTLATPNSVFAGPASGSVAGAPGFRALAPSDIPTNISITGQAGSVPWTGVTGPPTTLAGYGITDALQVSAGSFGFAGTAYGGHFVGDGSGLTSVTASAAVATSDTGSTCTPAQAGQFRYTNNHFQGCNGTNWTQLDNAPAPSIADVLPNEGPTVGGTPVTITGANFSAQALVTVGGAGCTVSGLSSATSIVCTTPPGSAGSTTVVVVNPDSQNGQKVNGFSYRAPTVADVAPAAGPAGGGTVVTVTGTFFAAGATATVNGIDCPVVSGSITATSLRCTTPAGSAGTWAVAVKNTDNVSGQKASAFTYYQVTSQTVYGGNLTPGTAKRYQYTPLSGGYVKASWTVPAWATELRVRVSSSTAYSGDLKAAYSVGTGSSATISGLSGTLQGAWQGSTSYYVSVDYVGLGGAVDATAHSGPIRIAEAVA